MTFYSILFNDAENDLTKETPEAPVFFVDLNLDQIIDAITEGKEEYDLKPFYYAALHDANAIKSRQAIMRDLENKTLMASIESFAQKMSITRRYLGLVDKLYYKYHKEGWILEAAALYCDAVSCLATDLFQVDLESGDLLAFREYMTNYASSGAFTTLREETKALKADLSTVKYCVRIKNSTVKVRKYENEADYSAEVERTFEKFKQGAARDYRVHLYESSGMNHVEAQILDCVARLYPNIFSRLDRYCARHASFLDETIAVFDREVQFFVAYLEYIAKFKQAGLQFCYPLISDEDKEIYDLAGFDLALANKLVPEDDPIVCNDFYLRGQERILVITGPNQGGKTTFARTFGQLHYLASLGCPVPGREARLFLYDRLFTHFEKEEDIKNLRGKLEDDLVRIHEILDRATSNSIIIMNEVFSSTTLRDAVFLGKKVMAKTIQLDALCVFVTFVDELASFSEKTVSLVSTVVPENPAVRTFKIVRKPADGLAYATSIAEKHGLTYEQIKERIKT